MSEIEKGSPSDGASAETLEEMQQESPEEQEERVAALSEKLKEGLLPTAEELFSNAKQREKYKNIIEEIDLRVDDPESQEMSDLDPETLTVLCGGIIEFAKSEGATEKMVHAIADHLDDAQIKHEEAWVSTDVSKEIDPQGHNSDPVNTPDLSEGKTPKDSGERKGPENKRNDHIEKAARRSQIYFFYNEIPNEAHDNVLNKLGLKHPLEGEQNQRRDFDDLSKDERADVMFFHTFRKQFREDVGVQQVFDGFKKRISQKRESKRLTPLEKARLFDRRDIVLSEHFSNRAQTVGGRSTPGEKKLIHDIGESYKQQLDALREKVSEIGSLSELTAFRSDEKTPKIDIYFSAGVEPKNIGLKTRLALAANYFSSQSTVREVINNRDQELLKKKNQYREFYEIIGQSRCIKKGDSLIGKIRLDEESGDVTFARGRVVKKGAIEEASWVERRESEPYKKFMKHMGSNGYASVEMGVQMPHEFINEEEGARAYGKQASGELSEDEIETLKLHEEALGEADIQAAVQGVNAEMKIAAQKMMEKLDELGSEESTSRALVSTNIKSYGNQLFERQIDLVLKGFGVPDGEPMEVNRKLMHNAMMRQNDVS